MRWLMLFVSFIPMCAFGQTVTKMPARLGQFIDNLGDESASFLQTKTIPESTKKFVSNGSVHFVKGTGFVWKQTNPGKMKFISTLDKFCVDNGEAQDLKSLPYFGRVARMIDGILNGIFDDFLTAFNVDYTEIGKSSWRIVATPKIATIAGFLSKITLNGSVSELTSIKIQYANDAQINIDFQKTLNGPSDEIKC